MRSRTVRLVVSHPLPEGWSVRVADDPAGTRLHAWRVGPDGGSLALTVVGWSRPRAGRGDAVVLRAPGGALRVRVEADGIRDVMAATAACERLLAAVRISGDDEVRATTGRT
jgi:hypothetical protein